MQPRIRLWIALIIALFVGSFLVGFQPIRRPPKEFVPEAAFEFRLDKALTEDKREYDAKSREILDELTDTEGGFNREDIEEVKLIAGDRIQIKTYALDETQMAEDERNLLKALRAKHKGVTLLERAKERTEDEPLFKLGNVLAIYRPSPQIKLGLDLQGGLHVVLRCLPYASMSFITPEDKDQPFHAVESDEESEKADAEEATKDEEEKAEEATDEDTDDAKAAKADKKPKGGPTITRPELERRIVALLVRRGLATEEELKVEVVAPNRLLVRTHAPDERTAKAQRSAVLRELQDLYPKYTINPDEFESVPIRADTADKVKNIIDKRLFSLGEIREPIIQKQGRDQIIVEIPGVKDPDRVAGILKSTALLEFRLIPQQYESAAPGEDMYDEWRDKRTGQMVGWDRVLAESKAEFHGADLVPSSTVVPGEAPGQWEVTFELKANKKRAFHEFTRRSVGRLMAIVLDGKCQMAPVIKSPIPGQGVIEGNFTTEEAGDLRLLLNAGALPVPLEIAENRTVSATLGQDAIHRSMRAGLLGFLAVLIFMVLYYRLQGLLADIALVLYILIVIAVVAASLAVKGLGGITLTLPGIAGMILSIGMAVDANVIIFERLKEEIWSGKSMRAAVIAGFDRAWTAILDANVTTLIVAAVLYFLGTSLIKSFAAMLFIGILCSLFTAVTVTRWLVTMMGETKLGQNLALFGINEADVQRQ